MASRPGYQSILIVDVEGSGQRYDGDKPLMRSDLYSALALAFARSGIVWDHCQMEDRGDGVYILVPPTVPKLVLATQLMAEIDRAVAESVATGRRVRLRLSLHAGEVSLDAHGSCGRDVDLAFALVDAAPVRQELRSHPSQRCVLVLSDPFHDTLIQYGLDRYDHKNSTSGGFHAVALPTKQGDRTAWLQVLTSGSYRGHARQAAPLEGLPPWQVRIGVSDGRVCGRGVLVNPCSVLTCGCLVPGGRSAEYGVSVVFGSTSAPRIFPAEVDDWVASPGGDPGLAVLTLNSTLPAGVFPARVAPLGHPRPGRVINICGAVQWPAEIVGRYRELVRIKYSIQNSRVGHSQVEGRDRTHGNRRSGPGSPLGCERGAAATDSETGEVVGLLVDTDDVVADTSDFDGWRYAVMAPIEVLSGYSPGLQRLLGVPNSVGNRASNRLGHHPNGRIPAVVSILEFSLILADLPTLRTEDGRDLVIGMLRSDIATVVPRHSQPRHDVVSLVQTCLNYPKGLDELISVLRTLEGDSSPMLHVLELHNRLG